MLKRMGTKAFALKANGDKLHGMYSLQRQPAVNIMSVTFPQKKASTSSAKQKQKALMLLVKPRRIIW